MLAGSYCKIVYLSYKKTFVDKFACFLSILQFTFFLFFLLKENEIHTNK